MYPSDEGCPIDLSVFDNLEGVLDAIYHPLCTNLVLQAREKGAKALGGLYMLVAQAVYASRLFLSKSIDDVDKYEIDDTYEKILAQSKTSCLWVCRRRENQQSASELQKCWAENLSTPTMKSSKK